MQRGDHGAAGAQRRRVRVGAGGGRGLRPVGLVTALDRVGGVEHREIHEASAYRVRCPPHPQPARCARQGRGRRRPCPPWRRRQGDEREKQRGLERIVHGSPPLVAESEGPAALAESPLPGRRRCIPGILGRSGRGRKGISPLKVSGFATRLSGSSGLRLLPGGLAWRMPARGRGEGSTCRWAGERSRCRPDPLRPALRVRERPAVCLSTLAICALVSTQALFQPLLYEASARASAADVAR